ncbi:glycosyltransferase [Isoptericola jiangsuensis]|uniref:glycosyltransferase n=1 Tax=Isoptericola jiangsuensis TaxID=548579 RepID=UPI003AACA8A1
MNGTTASTPDVQFPAGGYAAATWTIPEEYGGMTSALLRRSRAFVEHAGVPVRVLTFDPALDVRAAVGRLEDRDELVPGLTIHNVWEALRAAPDAELGTRSGRRLPRRERKGLPGERYRHETDAAGSDRRLVFRADRTLAAIDERRDGQRQVVAVTRRGYPARTWKTLWVFYRYWMRHVLPDRLTTVVVDSKSLVRFFTQHPRRRIYTIHLVHGAHLSSAAKDEHGPIVPGRGAMLRHVEDFDAVVLLTEAQRRDVIGRVGDVGRTAVVPNSTEIPTNFTLTGRDRGHGVMLAGLSDRKRIGDAIAGIDRARSGPAAGSLRLDVYGTGPEQATLAARAAQVPGVVLRGYEPKASARFAQASFMLLTSRSEGFPLVFAEAMARGCLPIAYDIRYGPADIVDHGVNGFLVPSGDIETLAATITRLLEMDEDEVVRMREAATATAQRFADVSVTERWAELFRDVAAARRLPA